VHSQKFYESCSPASSDGKRPRWTVLLELVAQLSLAVSPSLLALQVLAWFV